MVIVWRGVRAPRARASEWLRERATQRDREGVRGSESGREKSHDTHTLTRTHSNKTRDHLQLCKIRVIQICKPDALIHIHARMHAKVLYLGPMNPKFRAASRFLMHRISLHFIPQFDFGGGNISILKPGLGASRSAADVALEKRLRGLMRTGKIAAN